MSTELGALRDEIAAGGMADWLRQPLTDRIPLTWHRVIQVLPRRVRVRSLGDLLSDGLPARLQRTLLATGFADELRAAMRAELASRELETPPIGSFEWWRWLGERGLDWYGLQDAARYVGDYDWKGACVAEVLGSELPRTAYKKEAARHLLHTLVRRELVRAFSEPAPAPVERKSAWSRSAEALADRLAEGIGHVGPHELQGRVLEDAGARTACVVSVLPDCRAGDLHVWFRISPDGEVALSSSSCGDPNACSHVVAACRMLATWLDGQGKGFLETIQAPTWKLALDELAQLRAPSLVHRIVLELGASVRARAFRADGSPISVLDLHFHHHGPDHRLLMGLTEGASLLRAVTRHPRVEVEGRRVDVVEEPLEIRLEPRGEELALVVGAGDFQGDADGVRRLRRLGAVLLLPSTPDRLVWAEVLPQHERILRWAGTTFPREVAPQLVDAVEVLPVRARVLPGALGEPRPWDGRLGVELQFDARAGLTGRVRVLLPGDEPVAAATGTLRRTGRDAQGAWELVRDPAAERAAVDALWDALGLHRWHTEHGTPDSFVVPSTREAIDLAGALEQRPELVLTWRRPFRVARLKASDVRLSLRPVGAWFELGGEIEGDVLPLGELLSAIRDRKDVAVVGADQVVILAEPLFEELERLADVVDVDRGKLRVGRVHAAHLAADLRADLVEKPPQEPEHVAVPETLRAELRPYQVEGHAFLVRRAAWAPGAVLADDMGLGKTLQAIALMCSRSGPTLVVAPTSVLPNWRSELARFAPHLVTVQHHGHGRSREAPAVGPGTVLVTSWDLLVRDEEALCAVEWDLAVFDEAHAVKNPRTRRAGAASAVPARFRLALTGTPIENRLTELWSLLAIVVPGLLPREDQFRTRFQAPIEVHRDEERLRRLRSLVHPFLLRRTKGEVASELPAKTELVEHVVLQPVERQPYDKVRRAALERLGGGGGPQERVKVLAALTRLRQIACDARLVEPHHSTVGAKIGRLVELVDELRNSGERVLVFSEFTSLLDLCERALGDSGFALLRLDGSTSVRERAARVEAFQAGHVDVFLLSRKAGGTGINLTAATAVIHLDPWWNPAAEDQATDRAHRIGQTRPVTVVRLVAKDTLEERVLQMHADKRALVAAVLADANREVPLDAAALLSLLRDEEDDEAPVAAPARRLPRTDGHAALAAVRRAVDAVAADPRLSDATRKAYGRHLRQLVEWVEAHPGQDPVERAGAWLAEQDAKMARAAVASLRRHL